MNPRGEWRIEEPWREALAAAGMGSLEAWRTDERITIWRDVRERQNGVIELGHERFHVKRLRPPHGRKVLAEAQGIRLLEEAGIATVPLVAWGCNPRGEGVLVTRDLAGFRPADQLIADGRPFAVFAEGTARVAGRLHGSGLHHRDMYLCHFLFNEAGEVHLIDAARVRKLPWLARRRWIVKDLAQFRYSGLKAGATDAELDEWLSLWAGRMQTETARWHAAVLRKAASIAQHDRRLAQKHPERYRSLRS